MGEGYRIMEQRCVQGRLSFEPTQGRASGMGPQRLRGRSALL